MVNFHYLFTVICSEFWG